MCFDSYIGIVPRVIWSFSAYTSSSKKVYPSLKYLQKLLATVGKATHFLDVNNFEVKLYYKVQPTMWANF